jgi:uncharacterized membrane protein YidH (DUF202 family)
MRPLGWIGILLIVVGIVVAAMGGIPYTKSQNQVEVGTLKITAQERAVVPPYVGIVAIVLGGILLFAGRKRSV